MDERRPKQRGEGFGNAGAHGERSVLADPSPPHVYYRKGEREAESTDLAMPARTLSELASVFRSN